MSKIFNVPLVAQTSNNTCWHASSQMIWFYWQGVTNKQGPMNTIAENYKDDRGVTAQQFVTLAGKVGLKKVSPAPSTYTSQVLESLLNRYGPLWSAGMWFGVGHIIVLTGVDGEVIFFNDPDRGVKKRGDVDWFNRKLSKNVDGCLMYKDPNAY
jgi:ABC-type bacteriocin/lantibiotic exporter with double-glycine peptidase domain